MPARRRVAAAARSGPQAPAWPVLAVALALAPVLPAQALPIEQPAGVLPTPLRVLSDQPLAGAPDDEAATAAARRPPSVLPSAGAEGAEMGLIVHQLPVADSQGLLSEWMADAQFSAQPAAGASDAASLPAGGRLGRQPSWQRTPGWMATAHEADAAVNAALHPVQRDWVPPQPGTGGLGLSTLPGLGGELVPDDPRGLALRSGEADPFGTRPVAALPAVVRAFLRDNLALILAAVALVVGAAALAKAYARRI